MFRKNKKFTFETAKEAYEKIREVSNGKNLKIDIRPFNGILERKSKFILQKIKDTWYLKIK